MFTRKQTAPIALDEAITSIHRKMADTPADSAEYAQMVAQLPTLYALKETPSRVTPDTLAIVCGNLAGIAMMVGHERAHVITSKALAFVLKAR